MTRPLRIEFKGALYHVLSRRNEGRDIFLGGDDYQAFLDVLKELSERFEVDIFAYASNRGRALTFDKISQCLSMEAGL